METLKLSILQYNIAWENKAENFATVERMLASCGETSDVIVLPEMFSTGFSMNSIALAEETDGKTIQWVQALAEKYDVAVVGSFIAKEGDEFYNRGFFILADKQYFYDKRHLFRMGNESNHFSAGNKRLIVPFRGFNICLLVCYDLRFPVWSRNVNNEYDLLIYVANWPESRITVWKSLLQARALENSAYVCGANRVGDDGMGIHYSGESVLIDYKGNCLNHFSESEKIILAEISKSKLESFREKFPLWKDADGFEIIP